MKKALLLVLAALMIPSVALAAKPSHARHARRHVVYVLKGTLSNYTPYDAGTSTNGSITIAVKRANPRGKALKGATLTFPVAAKTRIRLRHDLTTITNGDRGLIRVRAARRISAAQLAATLPGSPARQILDRGVKNPTP